MATHTQQRRASHLRRFLAGAAILLAGLFVAPELSAQGPGNMDPAARLQQRMELLTQRLQLTAQQAEQVKPIVQKQFADQMALFQSAQQGGDRAAMRTQMQALRERTDQQMLAVLTDRQKPLYKALQEEEAARRRARMGGTR